MSRSLLKSIPVYASIECSSETVCTIEPVLSCHPKGSKIGFDPHLNKWLGLHHETGLSRPVLRRYFFCGSFMGFFLPCVWYAFVRVCLYVLCGHLRERADLLTPVCGV